MGKAAKPFVEMAESVGLKVERVKYGRHMKLYVVAGDGRMATFSVPVSPSDHRALKNKRAQMRRFADGLMPDHNPTGRPGGCAHCGAEGSDSEE